MILKGKTVLRTGASRGIGAAICVALAREGAKLILLAHPAHKDDLQQVCPPHILCLPRTCHACV